MASPAPVTAAAPPRMPTRTMTLPGAGRVVSRRAAKDPTSGLSAYLVKESTGGASCNVSVAIKRKGRYIGTVLRGHRNSIVDMEFLPTPPDSTVFTLGTCDQDGVVFLWFLRLAKDALGIDIALTQLRKYSFYSLRKNKAAFYNRIRLAGTPNRGTMVLVPNDGSNVRVIQFSCEPSTDPQPFAQIAAPEAVPRIEAPDAPYAAEEGFGAPGDTVRAREGQMQTPTPLSRDDYAASRTAAAAAGGLGAGAIFGAGVAGAKGMDDEEAGGLDDGSGGPTPPREGPNSTFPLSRRVENHGKDIDDDIAEAAARGAGLPEDDENDVLEKPAVGVNGVVEVEESVEDDDMYGEYEEEVGDGFSDEDGMFMDAKQQVTNGVGNGNGRYVDGVNGATNGMDRK